MVAMPTEESLAMIERLIAFDTTSSLSNLELIDDIKTMLEAEDIPCTLVHNEAGTKANLIAEIGPRDTPAIIVSGHTDVVPADSAQWTVTAPFEARRLDGRLYGRGSADMKGFIGIALNKLIPLHHQLKTSSVVLALSFDEELGCLGAPLMMPHLRDLAPRLRGAIIGEPTEMRIGNAHKGHIAARATIIGRGGHSGYPERGINAIDLAAELIIHLRRFGIQKRLDQRDSRFDPPYSTVHTGLIQGGSALNKIPDRCTFDFEMRTLPDQRPDELLDQVREVFPDGLVEDIQPLARQASLELECTGQYPQLNETCSSYLHWIAELTQGDATPMPLGFGCEAGLFAQLGIPAVVCGPGSIHQAHLPDEYITLDQISACEAFFERLITHLHAGLPSFN